VQSFDLAILGRTRRLAGALSNALLQLLPRINLVGVNLITLR
jgi:hypothetical protein